MTAAGRLAALGAAASMLLALNRIPEWPLALVTVGGTVAFGWWLTSGFWRTVALGAVGGALAGLVVLGPGWRVAMRVVAIMDLFTSPEFSLGGTMFIIIVIGALSGGVMGSAGNLLRHAAGIRSATVSGLALGLVLSGMLLAHLRDELTDLGGGVWVNLIMFGAVSILYGMSAMHVTDRLAARMARVAATTRGDVPA